MFRSAERERQKGCQLDHGSQEDGNQTGNLLPKDGAAALLSHLLGEKNTFLYQIDVLC